MKNKNNNYQKSDKKPTKQIRIDSGLHCLLKKSAKEQGESMKSLIEDALSELLAIDNQKYEN